MSDEIKKKRSGCSVMLGAAALALVVGWFAVGGFHGLEALATGRNPWSLVAPTPERLRETTARAEQIVAALERHRARIGEYPASLQLLVPDEMADLPRPAVGRREWEYSRPEAGRFVLDFFEGPIYEHSWWDSAEGRWNGDLVGA